MMVFTPIARAMFEILHAVALPDAEPEVEPLDHDIEIVPDPPAAEPETVTVDAVVIAAVGFNVSVSAAGAGTGVGAGGGGVLIEPVCAAYIVWIAAISPA